MKRTLALALLVTVSSTVFAAPAWKIVPKDSKLSFTATQNGSPVAGQFETFSGEFQFDPNDLPNSKAVLTVDMNSIKTSYGAIADTLKTADWFNVKLFPKAEFVSDKITKSGDKDYTASGQLKIRDKTTPATIQFTVDAFDKNQAHVKGATSIQRTQFGIGQGEWSNTDEVKDKVDIQFNLLLNPAS